MRWNKLILTFLILSLFTACMHKSEEDRFIDDLLQRMTIEEKIGQLNQLDPSWDTAAKEQLIREGRVGSLFNVVEPQELNRLQRLAVEQSRLGIPLVFARDIIHGFRTIYPIPLGQAASWDPRLVEKAAQQTAVETVQTGIRWTFSPMVDVAHDPRWGRIAEGYGEDPFLTSVMGAAVIRGYQYDQIVNDQMVNGLAACVKHFAGYSASEAGRDYNTTWIPETQLRDIYLPPFKAALDAGAMSVMCAFNNLNGTPPSANKHLNIDILRHEWHSSALLVSDWGSGADLVPHGLCADREEAALRCINARMEMDMQGNIYHDYLSKLLNDKMVNEQIVNECVRSVLRFKYRLGLFEHPYANEQTPTFYSSEALAVAQQAAEESAILLKNNGILPLDTSSACHILITGPMAHQPKEQLGTWVFDAQPEHSVTPVDAFTAICERNHKLKIRFEPGLTYSRDNDSAGIAKARDAARQADIILFFCGEEAILSGEARCRAELNLPGAQTRMMNELVATGKPVVMIVMAGRPLTIGREVEQATAVLYAFHPGTMAGPALANILTGKVSPSGKTPVTFPKMVGQIPLYYNRMNTGRPASNQLMLIDDIPVGCEQFSIGASSYWLETPVEPLFHFGFGLTYTNFEYSEPQITVTEGKNEPIRFTISCDITNTGNRAASEVAQLYARQLYGYMARPIKELKGFQKINIPAGETRTVTFILTRADLGYWHEAYDDLNSRVWFDTDTAEFLFWIAPDSRCQTTPCHFLPCY